MTHAPVLDRLDPIAMHEMPAADRVKIVSDWIWKEMKSIRDSTAREAIDRSNRDEALLRDAFPTISGKDIAALVELESYDEVFKMISMWDLGSAISVLQPLPGTVSAHVDVDGSVPASTAPGLVDSFKGFFQTKDKPGRHSKL